MAFQLYGGGCVLKKEVATPSSIVLVELIFRLYFAAGGQTILNSVFNKLDHRLQHTSCIMDMALREALNAMPYEYRDRSLEYNLLKQHISLYSNGACQCSVKRKIEEACSPFGSLEAAAVLCSFRGLPAPYRPCSYCGRPEHGGPEQGRPERLDLQLQTFGFKSLLSKELKKINDFFNLLHRQYIGRMKVSS